MVREYRCPVDGWSYAASRNDEDDLVEAAQQHGGDEHGDVPTREEVEQYLVGPG